MQISKSILAVNLGEWSIHLDQWLFSFFLRASLAYFLFTSPFLFSSIFLCPVPSHCLLPSSIAFFPLFFIGIEFCQLIASGLSSPLCSSVPFIYFSLSLTLHSSGYPCDLVASPHSPSASLLVFSILSATVFALPLFIHFSVFALMRLTGHTHTRTHTQEHTHT